MHAWIKFHILHKLYSKNQKKEKKLYVFYSVLYIYIYICTYTGKAFSSGNQHYFFTKVKEKRATANGYWKEVGVTEPIVSSAADKKVGIKKYFVFNLVEGTETSWVMQEYHICSSMFNTAYHGSTWGRQKPVSDFVLLIN